MKNIIPLFFLICIFHLASAICNSITLEQQCLVEQGCLWDGECKAILKKTNMKSAVEMETEHESESDSLPSPMQCAVFSEAFCRAYNGCAWTGVRCVVGFQTQVLPGAMAGGSNMAGAMQGAGGNVISPMGYGNPFDMETESESENESGFVMPGMGAQMGGMGAQGMPGMGGAPSYGYPFETETESESESESGFPMMPGGGQMMPGGMMPGGQMMPGMGMPGGPEYEFENESEQEMGGITIAHSSSGGSNRPTINHHYVGPSDGPSMPMMPGVVAPPGTPGAVVSPTAVVASPGTVISPPAQPSTVTPPTQSADSGTDSGISSTDKLECIKATNEEECALLDICTWDARQVCLPTVILHLNNKRAIACKTVDTSEQCMENSGCKWDETAELCQILPELNLRKALKAEACNGFLMADCPNYFGCVWDHGQDLCVIHRLQVEALPSETLKSTDSTVEMDESDTVGLQRKALQANLNAQSVDCLVLGLEGCHLDTNCFWDLRQICLPALLQTETTPILKQDTILIDNRGNQVGTMETEGESESENESEGPMHPAPPPMIPVGVDTETESESESESGSGGSNPYGTPMPVNTCFYHPDRTTCLGDADCFWDRRTSLCASLDLPNYLPADCEGFLYEAPCTLDKRCIWKTGECEELNMDCENIMEKRVCVTTTVNGIPCVWSDHEQECDEAPIFLARPSAENVEDTQPNDPENKFRRPLVLLVPLVLIVGATFLASRARQKTEVEEILMDEPQLRIV